MFTGIVEETGFVKGFTRNSNGAEIVVGCEKVLEDTKIGDSISVNGTCQTVVEIGAACFSAKVSNETLNVTTFNNLKIGDPLNLERALTLASRMGGHIVNGHIDCRGKFVDKKNLGEFYELTFEIPKEFSKYVVHKGSITINGISLTVAKINDNIFSAAIIPHTFEFTTFSTIKNGDFVNIETDILAKYVENFLSAKHNSSNITENFLQENGFL